MTTPTEAVKLARDALAALEAMAERYRPPGYPMPDAQKQARAALAAIDALPASAPSGEPAAPSICRVIAKGGKYTRGLYENPTRDHLLAWESDGDAVQWLAPIGSATTAPAPQADPNAGMGLPSCGKPLCSEGDHHPLCTMYLAAQAAPAPAPMADDRDAYGVALLAAWDAMRDHGPAGDSVPHPTFCAGFKAAWAARTQAPAAPAVAAPEPVQRGWLIEWPTPGSDKRRTLWSDSDTAAKAIGCPHEPVYVLRRPTTQEPQHG